jgi:hypothetical protein
VVALLTGWAARAVAHPGWGLVRDPARGIVYYTDLVRVWQIDRDGRRTIAVPDVHTHELRIDPDGTLYGEDLEGVGTGWRNRVWRRSTNGVVSDVLPWRNGFREDYGFVADRTGALYWAQCSPERNACVVNRRRPPGVVEVAGRGKSFARPLNFLAADPAGRVFLADGRTILRLTDADTFAVVYRGPGAADDRFALMGFQPAAGGEILAAAFADRAVIRKAAGRSPQVVFRSTAPWQPTAVLEAVDGLWITEYDGARVRQLHRDRAGRERTWGPD